MTIKRKVSVLLYSDLYLTLFALLFIELKSKITGIEYSYSFFMARK